MSAPLLARLYTPEAYGHYTIVSAIINVAVVLATAKFDLGIIVPRSDTEAKALAQLSIYASALITSLLCMLLIAISILEVIPLQPVTGATNAGLIFLAGFICASFGIQITLIAWLNRLREYKAIASSRLTHAIVMVAAQSIAARWFPSGMGLLIGMLIGTLASLAVLGYSAMPSWRTLSTSLQDIKAAAKKHSYLPRHSILTDLFGAVLSQLPVYFLGVYAGAQAVGFFGMAQRVLQVPMLLISTSIGEVFRRNAAEQYANTGECLMLFTRTFRHLASLALVPTLIVLFAGPTIFMLVFGHEWEQAGYYAQILMPMFALKFIANPLSYVFLIAGYTRLDMILHGGMLLLVTSTLYFAGSSNLGPHLMTALYSACYVIMYVIYLVLSYRLSRTRLAL
jgi:O-antigen/teichoic acid export membrane protein